MHDSHIIQQFVDAADLPSLRIAFSKLCTLAGEIDSLEVLLFGSYGEFCAFCVASMKTRAAEEILLRQFGFQKLGNRIYLPRALAPQFERRALARVA